MFYLSWGNIYQPALTKNMKACKAVKLDYNEITIEKHFARNESSFKSPFLFLVIGTRLGNNSPWANVLLPQKN